MLAKRVDELPSGENWIFEPKWDGFRALVFRDGDEIYIQSRDEKPMNRYFPDLLEPLQKTLPARCVLDGEIVIATKNGLDFDLLQLRLHPAASRVKMLAEQNPASFVFFDVLCLGNHDLRKQPFVTRRQELERALGKAKPPIRVTPSTQDRALAADWFRRFEGAGLDGVVAKAHSQTYEPNKRVMLKVKHERECDCVVAGFRWHKKANAPPLAHYFWVYTMTRTRCSTSGYAPASPQQSGKNLSISSHPTARMRSPIIPGEPGLKAKPEKVRLVTGCRVARAVGARVKIYRGNRCGLSSSLKSRTTTCSATAFAIPHSFGAGEKISNLKTVLMHSSRWFRRKNWLRFFPLVVRD